METNKTIIQSFEDCKGSQARLNDLSNRVKKLLADEKCTIAEAEDVLSWTRRLIHQATIVQGEFSSDCS